MRVLDHLEHGDGGPLPVDPADAVAVLEVIEHAHAAASVTA